MKQFILPKSTKKQNQGPGVRATSVKAGTLERRLSNDDHVAAGWKKRQRHLAALEIQAGLFDAPPSCQRIWFMFRITHPRHQVLEALAILQRRGLTIQHYAELWRRHGAMSGVLRIGPARWSDVPDTESITDGPGTLRSSDPSLIRNRIAIKFDKEANRRWPVKIRQAIKSANLP